MANLVRRREIKATDRLMSVAGLHYAASCEIFYPTISGASVYLCTDREMLFADHLTKLMEREGVTIWGATSTIVSRSW
jgi:hypothetical protein